MPSQNSASFFGKATPQTPPSGFSSQGRLGRLSYIARSGLCHFLFIISTSWVVHSLHLINWNTMMLRIPHVPSHPFLLMFVGLVWLCLYVYLMTIYLIRRLHDLNQSGWMSLMLMIPVLNLFLMLYVLMASGTPQINRYGAVQRTATWEKCCAWLLILLFIVSFASSGLRLSYMIGSGQWQIPQHLMKHGMQYL